MKNVTLPYWQLESLIEGLESAINVCDNIDNVDNSENYKNSYPYAVGFSKETMRQIIRTLKDRLLDC